ncbi:MAG: hypothetical protein Q4C47_03495, partial [Planctomycetia bacterium]|nr:hypothetical protein [Planctomycetia bacterium]
PDAGSTVTKAEVKKFRDALRSVVDEAFTFVREGVDAGIPVSVHDARFLSSVASRSWRMI